MGDKTVRQLAVKFDFRACWTHSPPPPPPNNVAFLFLKLHRPQCLRNIELEGRGTRESTLCANKIEQVLKYRKASFPKSVSTTFFPHISYCLFCYLMGCYSNSITWKTSLILVQYKLSVLFLLIRKLSFLFLKFFGFGTFQSFENLKQLKLNTFYLLPYE